MSDNKVTEVPKGIEKKPLGKNDIRLLYLSDAGPRLSVFASQSVGMYQAWTGLVAADLMYRHQGAVDSSVPGTPLKQIGSCARFLLNLEISYNNLRDKIKEYNVIHCRGAKAVYLALKSLSRRQRDSVRIIFDCRGLLAEENRLSWEKVIRTPQYIISPWEFRQLEKIAVKQSDIFLTVSEEMSQYFQLRYGRRADLVIPCVVDGRTFVFSPEKRELIRKQLGIDTGRLFLYVGGVDPWQRVDILGWWWSNHVKEYTRDILLILTGDKKKFLQSADFYGDNILDTIRFNYISYSQIPDYMAAADFGIMFRDQSLVNRVASPVKLSEYLASGLVVITNQNYIAQRDSESIVLISDILTPLGNLHVRTHDERLAVSRKNSHKFAGEQAVRQIIELL